MLSLSLWHRVPTQDYLPDRDIGPPHTQHSKNSTLNSTNYYFPNEISIYRECSWRHCRLKKQIKFFFGTQYNLTYLRLTLKSYPVLLQVMIHFQLNDSPFSIGNSVDLFPYLIFLYPMYPLWSPFCYDLILRSI